MSGGRTGSSLDRNMALAFGGLAVAVIAVLIASGSYYFFRLGEAEETRLLRTLSGIAEEAINRVSFSGKYHSQLLMDELVTREPAIVYMSISGDDGETLVAAGRSDSQLDPSDAAQVLTGQKAAVIVQRPDHVREVLLPYRVGYDRRIGGVLRIGVSFADQRERFVHGILIMVGGGLGLAVTVMLAVYMVSAVLSRPVKEMAGKLAGLLDLAPLIIIIRDAQGRLRDASASFHALMPAMTGAFADSDGRDSDVPSAQAVVRREETLPLDSGVRSFSVTKFPIAMDETGRPALICTVALDVTSQREAEAELRQRTHQLEQSNAELEQFAYIASHDLQEPLRMVASYVQLIERRYGELLDDDGREFIGFASEGAVRMQRMIFDLLDFSRVGRLSAPMTPLDIGRPLAEALRNLALGIQEAGAEVVVPETLPMVIGAGPDLVRLWQNLISNAIKYRHPDRPPRIAIDVRRKQGLWEFAVTDNGIGIPEEFAERVFLIFQRLHTRATYPGNGIGLALCRKIVEFHGGRIWVEPRSEGCRLVFTLRSAPDERA